MKTTGWYCKIIADSVHEITGSRITSFQVRFPRFILPQLNTNRALSKSAASSRAIPTKELMKRVEDDPVVPILTKNRKGMSGELVDSPEKKQYWSMIWREAALDALDNADCLMDVGGFNPHKQAINRLLEPFLWVDVVITATEWDNFFGLRTADDAQPEFTLLAKRMWVAMQESKPQVLEVGDWHTPYVVDEERKMEWRLDFSAARCARVSYCKHGTDKIDHNHDLELAAMLKEEGHMSPFEHQAQAVMSDTTRSNFDPRWLQYRKMFIEPSRFSGGDMEAWKAETDQYFTE